MENCYKFEYDYKSTMVKLFTDKGKLKEKYKCLSYMITFPLEYNNALLPPRQEIPKYNDVILKSELGIDGYLLYNIIGPYNYDQNFGIVGLYNNILEFKYFPYNYDVEVKILKIRSNKTIRFMYYNIYSLVASNMNDIYGNETVFEINDKTESLKFTITGEYQFFFTYSDADIELKISKSDKKTPNYICMKKSCKCKCRCYEKNNVGFIKIKDHNVPVYVKNITNNIVSTYLYPQFSILRELFLLTTSNNSLPIPEFISFTENNNYEGLKDVVNCQPGYVQSFPSQTALYQINITNYGEPLVAFTYSNLSIGRRAWQIRQLILYNTEKYFYSYKWDPFTVRARPGSYNPFTNKIIFNSFVCNSGSLVWNRPQSNLYPTEIASNVTEITFPGGTFINQFNYDWVCFNIEDGGGVYYPDGINITITIEPRI